MTNEEELRHKQVQATYLRKLLERAEEEIAELEREDAYADLKAAHAAGKRIACYDGIGSWWFIKTPFWNKGPEK